MKYSNERISAFYLKKNYFKNYNVQDYLNAVTAHYMNNTYF